MRNIKSGVMAVLAAIVMSGLAGQASAQYGDGDYPGYNGPTTPAGDCSGGCGPGAGSERGIQRVLRAQGARYEYVIIGPQGQAAAVLDAIDATGGSVIRTSRLEALEQTTQIATFPSRASFEAAQALIATRAPASSLAAHHAYGFAQSRRSPRLYAPAMIGDTEPGRCRVSGAITIGMIDGPVNPDHPALVGAEVRYETLVSEHSIPSANHGTAVAALMVGQDSSGALAGFAQGARLYAISVFSQRDEREQASVERIAAAIDRMVGAGVHLINLSISGPENMALSRALTAAASRGVVLIAASGNERRPNVAWPAASQDVIAVTAIDAARRRFFQANTGVAVEFAAPGVDVYTARSSGGGYSSGTSFAAPIVTALAARHMAQGAGSADAVRARLRHGVETLGAGTRNTEFGWGLVRSGGC